MKRFKKRTDNGIVDFWQSSTDLLLALALILLLVIAGLLLYLLQLPETVQTELWGTEANLQQEGYVNNGGTSLIEAGYEEETKPNDFIDDEEGKGDGDGDYVHDDEHEKYPIPTAGGGQKDEWGKSAVYVTVIDAETLRAIKEEGVQFELYEQFGSDNQEVQDRDDLKGAIRFLHTYYPRKIEYRKYETTDKGNYYLPEKIERGWYYLKELTEPEGYDSADVVYFNVDDIYDWPDPYVVSVPLYPSRNIIRAELIDKETGLPITEGKFKAEAAEDVRTADGTIRYVLGEKTDEFNINEESLLAESKELYLGKYLVSQAAAPKYYTTAENIEEITLEKKNGLEPKALTFYCEKTAIKGSLTDDMDHGKAIAEAVFVLTDDKGETKQAVTNANGEFEFTDLEKNTSYTLLEQTAPGEYKRDNTEYRFLVDNTGHIEGEAKAVLSLTNFIPRVEIGINDVVLHSSVLNKNISLYDSSDNLIRSWVSGGNKEAIPNLPAGDYYILINNKSGSRRDFTIEDPDTITTINYEIWGIQGILSIAVVIVMIPLMICMAIVLIRAVIRKRNKSKNGGKSE